ncbi:MAG: DUF1178 family protein [Thermodesulfobacteriota bacterium]
MITYDLECDQGHAFEGWFENAKGFTRQSRKGLVACPVCGSSKVSRRFSTFGIARHKETSQPPAPAQPTPMEKLVKFVVENFENVGPNFAKEALKMHYGVAEHRNIRGVSSEQEEQTLRDEGIPFFKVPTGITTPPEEDQ